MVIIPQRKRKKKPVVKKERKFDLGPRGELILIRKKGRGNYAIGMLEGRTTIQDRRGARFPVIEFLGDSTERWFGVDFPALRQRRAQTSYLHDSKYYDERLIGECISGNEKVLSYLENTRYKTHLDLIKRILAETIA